jgi:hypothetical protein
MKTSFKAFALLTLLALTVAPALAAAHRPARDGVWSWEVVWTWIAELVLPDSATTVTPTGSCKAGPHGGVVCVADQMPSLDHGCTIDPEGRPICAQVPSLDHGCTIEPDGRQI